MHSVTAIFYILGMKVRVCFSLCMLIQNLSCYNFFPITSFSLMSVNFIYIVTYSVLPEYSEEIEYSSVTLFLPSYIVFCRLFCYSKYHWFSK
jgi:hypothetical protein